MFGSGVYFSDCITKSAQYSRSNTVCYLFLCEVALGHYQTIQNYSTQLNKDGYDSVYGQGSYHSVRSE